MNMLALAGRMADKPMLPDFYKWPVDGHVHFHALSRVGPTLDAAVTNFRPAGGRAGDLLGALLLTQAAGERVFEALRRAPVADDWQVAPAGDERETVIARRDGAAVVIVCGRQLRTKDGLEVLALGTNETFPDGLPLAAAIAAVQGSGALAVLPWGFGKWLGERGRSIEAVLGSSDSATLFVGDNGSRLGWLGVPALVRAAEQRGFRVLPGGDPFAFGRDYRRVGSFGFLAGMEPDAAAPWRALREWLLRQPASPPAFGTASGPVRFAFNQVGIQIYNRFFRSCHG